MEEQAKASTFKKRTAHDGLEVLTRAKKKPALTTVAEEGSDSGVSKVDFMGMALSYGKPELEDEEAPESESQNGGQLPQVQKAAGKAKGEERGTRTRRGTRTTGRNTRRSARRARFEQHGPRESPSHFLQGARSGWLQHPYSIRG